MKRKFELGLLVVWGALIIGACCTTKEVPPSVDPTNNVSLISYRAAIEKCQDNLIGNILPSLQAMKAADTGFSSPQHSAAWWDAKIGLIMDTAALNSDVLAGSNVGKSK